jgi:ABC-type Fe3+-hydroxamate transport system substrate-binding protein
MPDVPRLGALPALLLALLLAMLCACGQREPAAIATGSGAMATGARAPADSRSDLPRIVSINPSLTAILLALDAGEALVGVDEFSALQHPKVAHLPKVGGLFAPSLEAVAALEPDAVVVVPSVEQRDFVARLRELGVRVMLFENIQLAQVLENIARLGTLVDRRDRAEDRIRAIELAREASRVLTADRPRPRTLIVLQRDPVFVVGNGGFIDELLSAAGGNNLGAGFDEPYPQVSIEWLIAAGPEVLIDMSDEPGDPLAYWSRWPAIPAVASERVVHLDPKTVTLPGPYLDRSLEALVGALHGTALADALTAAVRTGSGSGG